MKQRRMKGFTLIELIAVLVILAILALIVTPLVMNIVKKAKDSANKRSVDAYGKAVELAVANYLLDNGEYPSSLDNLTIEYSGSEVTCLTKTLNNDGSIYLSGCSVKNTEVLDSNNADGYYHFGTTTVSSNPEPTYDTYEVGDEVTYNGIDFYVIEDSDENSDSVKLLKKTPLMVAEVNQYGGVGTENNHVNMYLYFTNDTTASYYQTADDYNGYGGMVYYGSATCGTSEWSGCTTEYANSEIKYVVDSWGTSNLTSTDLKSATRLITYDELMDNLGYSQGSQAGSYIRVNAEYTPSWVYNNDIWYWTMTPSINYEGVVFIVDRRGHLDDFSVQRTEGVVRPVATLYKSAISS